MQVDSLPKRPVRLELPSLRNFVVAALLLLISWGFANSTSVSSLEFAESSITRKILVTGAIPWSLQLVATLLVIGSICRSRAGSDSGLKFTAAVTGMVGIVWWVGIAITFYSQNAVEAILHDTITSVEQQFAGESLTFIFVHRICGPLISIVQLRGLLSLSGMSFFFSLISLSLLTGYLMLTASVCRIGQNDQTTARDFLRALLMFSVIFIPSMIRFAIDMSRFRS